MPISNQPRTFWIRASVCILLAVSFSSLASAQGQPAPTNVFTHIPAYGTSDCSEPFAASDCLMGQATNFSSGDFVAVLIMIEGVGWFSKPACDSLVVPLAPDGTWATNITTGGVDQTAVRIVAYLLPSSVTPTCLESAGGLPENLESNAKARAFVTRYERAISFSGYDWWLKASAAPVGPSANFFSDSTDNVWLDDQGRLHLRITNRNNVWYCPEVISQQTPGYGTNTWVLDSPVDNLDPNVVLGFFTWSDNEQIPGYHELDIEFSRWGDASDTNNAQYIVQPLIPSGVMQRFQIPSGIQPSSHVLQWQPSQIFFQSAGDTIINQWSYTGTVPVPGDQNVRMNLWLMGGNPPTNGQEVEVIIRSYQFTPLKKVRGQITSE